jgi:hypothetical protein
VWTISTVWKPHSTSAINIRGKGGDIAEDIARTYGVSHNRIATLTLRGTQMADQTITRELPASGLVKVLLEYEEENNAFIRHYEDVGFKITQINVTLSDLLIGASHFRTMQAGKILRSIFIICPYPVRTGKQLTVE